MLIAKNDIKSALNLSLYKIDRTGVLHLTETSLSSYTLDDPRVKTSIGIIMKKLKNIIGDQNYFFDLYLMAKPDLANSLGHYGQIKITTQDMDDNNLIKMKLFDFEKKSENFIEFINDEIIKLSKNTLFDTLFNYIELKNIEKKNLLHKYEKFNSDLLSQYEHSLLQKIGFLNEEIRIAEELNNLENNTTGTSNNYPSYSDNLYVFQDYYLKGLDVLIMEKGFLEKIYFSKSYDEYISRIIYNNIVINRLEQIDLNIVYNKLDELISNDDTLFINSSDILISKKSFSTFSFALYVYLVIIFIVLFIVVLLIKDFYSNQKRIHKK